MQTVHACGLGPVGMQPLERKKGIELTLHLQILSMSSLDQSLLRANHEGALDRPMGSVHPVDHLELGVEVHGGHVAILHDERRLAARLGEVGADVRPAREHHGDLLVRIRPTHASFGQNELVATATVVCSV